MSSITGSPIVMEIVNHDNDAENSNLMNGMADTDEILGEFHQTTAAVTANISFEAFCGSLTQK